MLKKQLGGMPEKEQDMNPVQNHAPLNISMYTAKKVEYCSINIGKRVFCVRILFRAG